MINQFLRNNIQWNFYRKSNIFIQENAFESAVCKMAVILSRPQCVNGSHPNKRCGHPTTSSLSVDEHSACSDVICTESHMRATVSTPLPGYTDDFFMTIHVTCTSGMISMFIGYNAIFIYLQSDKGYLENTGTPYIGSILYCDFGRHRAMKSYKSISLQ